METRKDYTVQIFKMDGRRRGGEFKLDEFDFKNLTQAGVDSVIHECRETWPEPKYRVEVHATWVTRKNLISGREFQERFDTPLACSPSSETYFSM